MFDPVDPRQSFPALERGIQRYWQEEDTFKRSIHQRSVARDILDSRRAGKDSEEIFSFYDGPPFATGMPHYGHLLAGTIKDVIPRYQTMKGKRVERRFGWDCHGLPIENLVEKEHNLKSKQDIERIGIREFNKLCRGTVQRYTKEWRIVVERMGRWVDMDWDYRTMDPEYMESIWWVFRSLWDKKLIYEGHKPMHICPRCQTPLSNFEVTQGYKEITDVSAYVLFALKPEKAASGKRLADSSSSLIANHSSLYFVAWTTTPWTLPGNLFLAVAPKVKYAVVSRKDDPRRYIVAKPLLEKVFPKTELMIEKELTSKDLVGMKYVPLFPYFAEEYMRDAFRVVKGDFVTMEDGAGIVHIAPGFGEDDFEVGKKEKVPLLQHVGIDGRFKKEVTDFAGMDVKPKDDPVKTDRKIVEWLEKHGRLLRTEKYKHSYPHCWRCDSPLLNYATSSWFVAVEKIKETMLKANAQTEWVPSHLRDGRFGKWLEGARDWAISRNRYWGTPLPIWRCAETGDTEVIGSREELMQKKLIRFTRLSVLRHGESEGNVVPRYQGNVPGTDLTKRGLEQAKAAGEWLAEARVAKIYCSPLARTRQTAEAIAKETGAEVVVDGRLREIAFGEYEGKSIDFSDLAFVKARRAHKLETNQVESIYHFPGMETWSDVQARIKDFLGDVLPRHRGEHIVVVTHADPAQNVRHFFTQEDPMKLCNQPYPSFASPYSFYWDHDTQASADLHKETVDDIVWPGGASEASVNATLVRHGETDWNAAQKIQGGSFDIPLNDRGRQQAQEAGKKLAKKPFDVIISSDLSRAKETAEIIGRELGLPVSAHWPELRERDLGAWNGMQISELNRRHPVPGIDPNPAFHPHTPEDGESLSHFLQRLQKAYDRILREFPGKRVLIVIHRGAVQALLTVAQNLTLQEGIVSAPSNAGAADVQFHPLMRRIPDVLDCWFESGSMPYAQFHFPFGFSPSTGGSEKRLATSGKRVVSKLTATRYPLSASQKPPGFPADFIAEGIDQTRGWFYTLTVLSSALYGQSPFRHCIVNGTVLAEDGKKMSKRLKNYPEPLEVVEKHGADAVRFALMSSPAVRGEDLRFSEKTVEESLRSVLLPLWNTYSFFVTYANAAGWEPGETRRTSSHPLDQWILAEVQDLVNRMTAQLDAYDLSATCAELAESIDALTNWYVRLSRRRFAGKGSLHGPSGSSALVTDDTARRDDDVPHDEDRNDALHTLYDVLLTLSQLLAPFCPFITDAIYLNLVSEEHGSIHLTDWPRTRTLKKGEEELLRRNRLLRTIVSLGLKIRSEHTIKVRQPLARATIAIPEGVMRRDDMGSAEIRLLQEELNVKSTELTDDPGSLGQAIANVDARKVGPRLGGRVQELIQAGKRGEFTVEDNGAVLIQEERLNPDEVTIVYRGREGENIASDHGIVVSIDMRITPTLKLEGNARDLIRAVQQLRKEAGLELRDRIVLSLEGAEDILDVHQELILQELQATIGEVDAESHVLVIDGKELLARFRKIKAIS